MLKRRFFIVLVFSRTFSGFAFVIFRRIEMSFLLLLFSFSSLLKVGFNLSTSAMCLSKAASMFFFRFDKIAASILKFASSLIVAVRSIQTLLIAFNLF